MPFLKRFFKFMIFIGAILIPFNYFFAHFAFNRVLNDFVQSKIPQNQSLKFSSSFHFMPKPFIQVENIDYLDAKDGHLKVALLKAVINLTQLIKTKSLVVNDLIIHNLILRLPAKEFDEFLKAIIFSLIREGLGVPKNSTLSLPPNFEIENIRLERSQGGDNIESFDISSIHYVAKIKNFMNVCFASEDKVRLFNQKFVAQYIIAATVEGKCLTFSKSLTPPVMPPSMNKIKPKKN